MNLSSNRNGPIRIYSIVLLLLGFIGYASNPAKAHTALIFASGAGALFFLLSYLMSRRVLATLVFLYASCVLFRLFLLWSRNGFEDKPFALVLLAMIAIFGYATSSFIFMNKSR